MRFVVLLFLCGGLGACTVTLKTAAPPLEGMPGVSPGVLPPSTLVANVEASVADASNLVHQRFPDA